MIRDLYRRLSKEWGSLARKWEGRQRKSRLRLITREELEAPTTAEIKREVDALPNPECSCADCRRL